MSDAPEVESFLRRHLDSVFNNDVADYHATTAEDLTLYEWCFTPVAPRWLRVHDPDQYMLITYPAIRQN